MVYNTPAEAALQKTMNRHGGNPSSQANPFIEATPMKLLVCLPLLCLALTVSAAPTDPLEKSFVTPPPAARAHTMWMWMNGYITKEGITADMEAMARVGIGGVKIFNISTLNSFPKGPVSYLSTQWLDLFQYAVSEATCAKIRTGLPQLRRLVVERRAVGHT